MLHDGRQRNRKGRGNLGHRQLWLVCQAIDDRAPRGVGERREGKIELRVTIVNHTVKYRVAHSQCQEADLQPANCAFQPGALRRRAQPAIVLRLRATIIM